MSEEENSIIDAIDDTPSEQTQKKWGKEDGGQFIIDGFTLKGKHSFKKAKDGLAGLMKKGVQSDVDGFKFRVLDSRFKGAGQEIDVEIIDNGIRGVGVIKLYGPNKSKEYVVMVTKSKGSDNKYVIILAGKVVKPLMKKFLNDDLPIEESKEMSDDERMTKSPFKCPHCEKTLNSSPGLKGHVNKMHKNTFKKENIETKNGLKDIDEDVLLSDTTEVDDNLNLDEACVDVKTSKPIEKKYNSICENCDLEVEANIK